jgi:ABC-type antimicrobial peptide transport system permease subunit
MNLSTARSERRAKEVGIRKSIGSLRGQLVGQFLSESVLVAFVSLVFSLALVQFALPWFNGIADKKISLPIGEPAFWLALVGFTLFTGLLAGSYPAFYLSSFQPLKVLKGTFRAGRWASVPRQALVVVQFTVSVALIIGTLVVFNQIQHAKNRPVGYERSGLLQANVSSGLTGKYDVLRNDLLASGVVQEMSQSNSPTTDFWSNQFGFDWDGTGPNYQTIFGIVACTHEYGKSIGWKIVQGRDFSREFATDSAALILNEAAVKQMGIPDIVGKTVRKDNVPYTVIGVVENMVVQSPYDPHFPTVYNIDSDWGNYFNVRLKPDAPVQDALTQVEAVFKKHDPASPFKYKFADDEYDAKFQSEQRIGKLARVFAILAIFISCLGLFGLSSYVAEQRTKEIGIRKVLGATTAGIVGLLSKDFLSLVILSLVIASPMAYFFMEKWLQDFAYRIDIQWTVFALAGILAVAVAFLTVSFQSVKAALANPVKSLHSE